MAGPGARTGGKGEEMVPYGTPADHRKEWPRTPSRRCRYPGPARLVARLRKGRGRLWQPDPHLRRARDNPDTGRGPAEKSASDLVAGLRRSAKESSQCRERQCRSIRTPTRNSNAPAATPTPSQGLSVLPDEKTLVSYNPIVALQWTQDDIIYLETAYVKRMKNAADNVTSFARWHRVILSAQPAAPANK